MSADRQQRRHRKRQLLQLGEAATKRGLPPLPGKDQMLGLALVLREMLADTSHADRASRAAALMHKVFEASLKATPPRLELACRKGCGYCCHTWVSATAPEIFLLARTLQAMPGTPRLSKDAILERAGTTAGLGIAERFGRKLPCALLVDDSCSMYASRPTVCRQATSTELAACIEEYEGKDFEGDIVVSKVFLDHARNCRIPLQAALLSLGLPPDGYELGAGLRAALETGAEADWLARADPFAGIDRAPADPAPIQQAVKLIAAEISSL